MISLVIRKGRQRRKQAAWRRRCISDLLPYVARASRPWTARSAARTWAGRPCHAQTHGRDARATSERFRQQQLGDAPPAHRRTFSPIDVTRTATSKSHNVARLLWLLALVTIGRPRARTAFAKIRARVEGTPWWRGNFSSPGPRAPARISHPAGDARRSEMPGAVE